MNTPLSADDVQPFTGLKVVDLSQGVAGPHCGMLLAQNGADVVKVEPPGGDWGRAIGAQYGDFCAYNIAFNRGKRSIALDLKSDTGLTVAKQLAAGADVVVENYRPGVLQRFGLDYETLKTVNPDVIYVSVTGFGQDGPKAKLPATDAILQSFSGLMSVNRDQCGLPQRIGVLVIDVVTGLYGFQAVTTALYKRVTRGGGHHISVSLMESIGAVQAGKMIEFYLEGAQGKKPGVPVATFQTADGYMTINARRDSHFKSLCQLLGCTELLDDPRFETAASRLTHEAQIMPALVDRIKSWHNAELDAALTQHDILHGTVNDYADYFTDAHVQEVGAVTWLDHLGTGVIPIHRIPGLPTPTDGPLAKAPSLGAHSVGILLELGFTASQIDNAVAEGAITVMADN